MNLHDRPENPVSYELTPCAPGDLTAQELKRCIAIIGEGGAVSLATLKRDLPRSSVLAIARHKQEIVGIGAIKPLRKEYAANVAVKSGFTFPSDTLELGYVAVDPAHRGRGLSLQITRLLLSQHTDRLFATTYDDRMKHTLETAGFVKRGREWKGRTRTLSFWEIGAEAPTKE